MVLKHAWKDGLAIFFLLLLNGIYFFPVLAMGNGAVLSLRGTDTWTQFYYWRHFAFESIGRGELPLWNPYIFSGTPFVAGIQSALFYPLNALFLIFSTPFAINFSIALHCFLASLFTYRYGRYLGICCSGAALSGVCFAYGAPYFLHIFAGHLPHLSTMIWLPLLFLAVEALLKTRQLKYAVLGGIALALQLLAGFPQYLVYGVIAVSLYFVIRVIMLRADRHIFAHVRGYAVLLIAGVLLGAVQLLPTAEFARYSFREALSYEWVGIFSLPPESLLTLLLPDCFGNIVDAPYWGKNYPWEMCVYVGVIPLALAAVALLYDWHDRVIAFAVIAAASLVLALGKYTPLLAILYKFVPSFDRFRGLSKFVLIFAFANAMLAGFGLAKLTALAERKKRTVTRLSYGLLGVPILVIVMVVAGPFSEDGWWRSLIESYAAAPDRYYSLSPLTNAVVNRVMWVAFSSLVASCILLALLGAALLVAVKQKRFGGYLLPAILILAAADLWHFGSRYLVHFSPQDVLMDKEVLAFLKTDPLPFRIASPLDRFINVGLYEGIENVGGYDTLVLKDYTEFINFAQGLPLVEPRTDTRIRTISPLFDLLNARYFVLNASMQLDHPDFRLAFENENYRVYRNHKALPRSFIVHQVRVVKDRENALQILASRDFNPAQMAVVEETVAFLEPSSAAQSSPPTFRERSLNRVVIEANLDSPGLVVLADVFYPGWKCFVDGKENKIYRTDYVLRSVFVPAGKHTVEFKYDPWSFKIGAIISLSTLIAFLVWLMWACIRDRKALTVDRYLR